MDDALRERGPSRTVARAVPYFVSALQLAAQTDYVLTVSERIARSYAQALGLSRGQTLRHVVIPQAVRRVVPPLLNDFVSLQKDTALASAAGIFEAVFVARDYANYNFNFTPYIVVACFFIAMTIPLARLTDWLAARARRREFAGAL